MHRLNVLLPDHVHGQIKRLAKAEGIPVKQYVECALTRHIELVEAGVPNVNEVLSVPTTVENTAEGTTTEDTAENATAKKEVETGSVTKSTPEHTLEESHITDSTAEEANAMPEAIAS